jgi:hypothetical protein
MLISNNSYADEPRSIERRGTTSSLLNQASTRMDNYYQKLEHS